MAIDNRVNFGYSTVATAPSPANSGTSLVVAAGHGARFPAASFNAIVWPANQIPLSTNAEIVRVTAISTDTFTITRTQEGTSARSIQVGDQIMAGPTKKMIDDIEADIATKATGAASSTDNAVARFDGTTGKVIQNSGVTINDSNDLTVGGSLDVSGTTTITEGSSSDTLLVGKVTGDSNNRFKVDGNGSVYIGGTGSQSERLLLRRDIYSSEYLNFINTAGPASIFIIDSDSSSDQDADSAVTLRTVTSDGTEFLDIFHNHYLSNGDVGYGILIQKTGTASYREFVFAFYDEADTDPANQIKEAERFYRISPTAATGSTTSRIRGQIKFRPIGSATASAHVHIGAGIGGATTGSAPLKVDSGTLLTTPEDGAVEYDGTHWYATIGSTRYQLDQQTTAPAGSDGQLQYNNGGSAGGASELTYDDATGFLGVGDATPNAKVHVSGNESSAHGTAAAITITNVASGGANWHLRSGATGNTTPAGGFSIGNDSGYWLNITSSGEVSFSGDVTVPDEAYGAGWNGSLEVPTKNAVYDKIETISVSTPSIARTFAFMGS